jgi:hypothetical protein
MRRTVSLVLTALAMICAAAGSDVSARQATPTGAGPSIHGTITATGRDVFM